MSGPGLAATPSTCAEPFVLAAATRAGAAAPEPDAHTASASEAKGCRPGGVATGGNESLVLLATKLPDTELAMDVALCNSASCCVFAAYAACCRLTCTPQMKSSWVSVQVECTACS